MFVERLERLRAAVPGAKLVSLVAGDGLPVESAGHADIEVDALAAELVGQTRSMSANHRDLGAGAVRQITVFAGPHAVLVGEIADRYYLMLVLGPGGDVGRARFAIKRARLEFEPELS